MAYAISSYCDNIDEVDVGSAPRVLGMYLPSEVISKPQYSVGERVKFRLAFYGGYEIGYGTVKDISRDVNFRRLDVSVVEYMYDLADLNFLTPVYKSLSYCTIAENNMLNDDVR